MNFGQKPPIFKFFKKKLFFALPCGTIFFLKISVKTFYLLITFCCFMRYNQWILVKSPQLSNFSKTKFFSKNINFGHFHENHQVWKILNFWEGLSIMSFGYFHRLSFVIYIKENEKESTIPPSHLCAGARYGSARRLHSGKRFRPSPCCMGACRYGNSLTEGGNQRPLDHKRRKP